MQVHGTCVALNVGDEAKAVLLRGPSGSGKSDLALRLIDSGGLLVADDQVELEVCDGALWASTPQAIAGRMEVRGVGILSVPSLPTALLVLVIDLVDGAQVPRLPEVEVVDISGVGVRCLKLDPFAASTPAKVRLAIGVHGSLD